MTMRLLIENVVVQKGSRKSDGKTFYFVEVMQPVRKYIDPALPQDAATLEALADSGQVQSELILHSINNSLKFSSADLSS